MKLTAGQCPALLTAIGKEIRDLWHGFKTFVTGDYTEIDMGGNSAKTADGEEKSGDTLTANEMATIVVPGTERATLVTWDITNYLNDTNFNENAQVMYQYDQDGKEKASYTYGEADQRINGDLTKEAVKYTEQKAGDYTYLYDGQGNVTNTVRNGSVAESYSYDPFGEMTAEGKEGTSKTPLEAQNDNGLSDNDVLWGYNGEEYIEEVGLQYLRQRHYSPETGTFTSQDTNEGDLTNPLSQNRYIYAENDPVNGNDPGGDKKKSKKSSTKKTSKKSSKSSSKSSKKTSKKTNKKTTSKKSPSKKKASSKKSSSKKSGSKWNKFKSYVKGRYTATKKGIKKGYRVLKDKATALKKSVTCKAKKVARIDRKISKALMPKKKDSVVKKYLKGAGSNLYGQYKDLARAYISGNGDLTFGILKETSKSLSSSLLHPKRSLKGLLNYYPDMVKKNGLAYTAGNISVDIAEIAIAKKVSSGAIRPPIKYPKSSLKALKRTGNFKDSAINHIFEGEVNKRGKAVGYHYENIRNSAGQVIKGSREKPNKSGVYTGKVKVNDVPKTANGGKSNFFPKSMSPQQVIDAINEAYANRVFVRGNTYEGTSSSGMKIMMFLDKNDKIISAFPKE